MTSMEIDDSLYSRQRYVLGDSAMQLMARSSILIYGLGGLGAEIAKNITLTGVKSLVLQDAKLCCHQDLGCQFFLRLEDVRDSKNRAEASKSRVAELNPYVTVSTLTSELNDQTDLSYLTQFTCVVLTEASMSIQLRVNEFCRSQSPPIKFISADVYGVFSWLFCDFGPEFDVSDADGEEPREVFIADITKGSRGVVTTLEHRMHGYETGDTVTFKEIGGMHQLNNTTCQIEVLTPYKFTVGDTSQFSEYTGGGRSLQVKVTKTVQFQCLQTQLQQPSLVFADLTNFDAPGSIHVGMIALHQFVATYGRLPSLWCSKDADQLLNIASQVNAGLATPLSSLDIVRLRHLAFTARGCFAPLCAFLGGVVAQEALKALTGKFTPLNQWLFVDAVDVVSNLDNTDIDSFQAKRSRYDALRMCIGEDLCKKLANLRLFMVGCGAIGCELLKNFALLGIGSASGTGQVTVTDNDLIEKSNLNRQFLFRPHHIRQPKSTTAAAAVQLINPDMNIEGQQHKVCKETENTVYTDTFFCSLDVVVNALDNLEARRYMDSRCVTNQRPLLESGTMGSKGHVQVIVPHLTESYSSQRDPVDEDVPYCTLKSFPAVIEHCIEWSRDKFETIFTQKPVLYNRFWTTHHRPETAITLLEQGAALDGAIKVSKLTQTLPRTWPECVVLARIKFEKYFNHKAQQLLHAFPLDTRLKDGSPFWQSPKRPPTPLVFNINNELHLGFVVSCARLYATNCGISYSTQDLTLDRLGPIIDSVKVPQFEPKNKKIVVDETAKKPEQEDFSGDEMKIAAHRLRQASDRLTGNGSFRPMVPAVFEKDCDENAHIDFIAAASNLRACVYGIETVDRLRIKRIAGRIVPAIITTTSAVSGLVAIELIKLVKKAPLEQYKNAFLNLALPVFVFSEPAAVVKSTLSNGDTFSIWDRWEVFGRDNLTIQQFIQQMQTDHKVQVSLIVHGVKMVYVPIMPGHMRRLPEPMLKYIKPSDDKPYVDLVVSYHKLNVQPGDEDTEEMGPPVRYYFKTVN